VYADGGREGRSRSNASKDCNIEASSEKSVDDRRTKISSSLKQSIHAKIEQNPTTYPNDSDILDSSHRRLCDAFEVLV
jgi:hypothetical protein